MNGRTATCWPCDRREVPELRTLVLPPAKRIFSVFTKAIKKINLSQVTFRNSGLLASLLFWSVVLETHVERY